MTIFTMCDDFYIEWSFSFFFSFNWNVDKVISFITYAYLKKNYSHWNDNRKEPTSSYALSISLNSYPIPTHVNAKPISLNSHPTSLIPLIKYLKFQKRSKKQPIQAQTLLFKISKSTMIISHCEKIEPKKLLEFLTVNAFNLKKNKGGCRVKLNAFNLKKSER